MTISTVLYIFIIQVFASFAGIRLAVWLDERKCKKKHQKEG